MLELNRQQFIKSGAEDLRRERKYSASNSSEREIRGTLWLTVEVAVFDGTQVALTKLVEPLGHGLVTRGDLLEIKLIHDPFEGLVC